MKYPIPLKNSRDENIHQHFTDTAIKFGNFNIFTKYRDQWNNKKISSQNKKSFYFHFQQDNIYYIYKYHNYCILQDRKKKIFIVFGHFD